MKTQLLRSTELGSLLAAFCIVVPAAGDDPAAMRVVAQEGGWLVQEGERDVLFYQQAVKAHEGNYPRANYVHPLYDLDGNVLTEDFPPDHLHHRGVFWAWHQMWVGDRPIGDPWVCRDFVWDVEHAAPVDEGPERAALRVRVLWKSPQWTDAAGAMKPLVREETLIRVHRSETNVRKIDFEIGLLALEENVRLGGSDDEKGYGGFCVRVRLPQDVRFLGGQDEVEPQVTSVEAGPWLDIAATFDGQQPSGVTILQHPSVPGFPQRWILRRKASMQNPAWPGRKPVFLSTTKPLMLRYRLVLHRGPVENDRREKWFQQYASSLP